MCSEVFISKDSLLNHKESVHTENVPLLEDSKCKLCSKVFSTNDSLLYHEESVHTETDSKDQTNEIKQHDEKNHSCPHCDLKF